MAIYVYIPFDECCVFVRAIVRITLPPDSLLVPDTEENLQVLAACVSESMLLFNLYDNLAKWEPLLHMKKRKPVITRHLKVY